MDSFRHSGELKIEKQSADVRKNIFRKMMIFLVYLFLAAATLPFNLFSQTTGGGYAGAYLLRDIGARPVSMAGAYTAVVNEPGALFYNPSGLSFFSDQPMFTTMYSFLEHGRTHSAIAWGQTVMENLGVGLGFNAFSSGAFMSRDLRGRPLGEINEFAYTVIGGVSYKIEYASLGVSAKYLGSSLIGGNASAGGYGIDLGMKFNVIDLFSVGVAVNNAAGTLNWNTPGEPEEQLPFTVRTGIAMEYGLNDETYTTRSTVSGEPEEVYIPATRYILFSMDFLMTQYEQSPELVIGAEAVLHELLALRGGIGAAGSASGRR